jgi:hypothetical protein
LIGKKQRMTLDLFWGWLNKRKITLITVS